MTNTIHEQAFQAVQDFVIKRERKIQTRQSMVDKIAYDLKDLKKNWTITQLHIVSLINSNNNPVNNTFLANKLNISKAAVSKAISVLMKHNILSSHKNENNNREIYYTLTEEGKRLAAIHDQMHEIVKNRYIQLFKQFSDSELEIVIKFLNEWSKLI
ncbi:MarR family transcriptional regulator [Thermaerobacillus caldiproteolyticus]|uniref:MarR family transcriptional regulator n=1 Tax=Thermaerobacillus caldiproteolyticus TaxID=247480 RepID=UPI001889D3F3|nr:MarR family transcriptional regulator [Anoxybacillus caldiproteolyticus]QPA31682.1 MarR family transcriptional regulator [Anoxybacillus caldiproteolyticus]